MICMPITRNAGVSRLNEPSNFDFTPLDDALGMDVADALPEHPEARFWRRILNEIQVALHHCPVNIRRRQSGRREINSVWFWGGGFIPDATPHDLIDTVYSNNPVTRGLAIINDCRLKRPGQGLVTRTSAGTAARYLSTGVPASQYAEEELAHLEGLVRQLVGLADRGQIALTLYDGIGEGRLYDRAARRRFWRRKAPLATSPDMPPGHDRHTDDSAREIPMASADLPDDFHPVIRRVLLARASVCKANCPSLLQDMLRRMTWAELNRRPRYWRTP